MSTTWLNATIKALVDQTLYEIMFKTTGDQVYLDENTQLSPKIAEIVAALNDRAKKEYVDEKVSGLVNEMKQHVASELAKLINGAPNTLDTLGEVAAAMAENIDVVEALEKTVGNKITTADANALVNALRTEINSQITKLSQTMSGHTSNKNNPHGVTKSQIGLGNVDNTADANKSVKYAASAGTAETATKATQDAEGNDISSTYATKEEVKAASDGMRLYIDDEIPADMSTIDIWFNTKGR